MSYSEHYGGGNLEEARGSGIEAPGKLVVGTASVANEDHPETNEDATFSLEEHQAFGVFDGMGGAAAGEVASSIGRDYIAEAIRTMPEGRSLHEVEEFLRNVLKEASDRIRNNAEADDKKTGMGATASVVKIFEDPRGGRKAVIGNVGDSRVYIMRADGTLDQVTLDDGILRGEMEKGFINEQEARRLQKLFNNCVDPDKLTEKERRLFDNRHILSQALGHRVEPRMHTIDIRDGDRVIVTSDGIHDNLTDEEMQQIIATVQDGNQAAQALVHASGERSRDLKHLRHQNDDMSAIVVGLGPWQKQPQPLERATIQSEQARAQPDQIRELDYSGRLMDFPELFRALDASGGLQGSEKWYSVQELKDDINKVRTGELEVDKLTRTGGLRRIVIDLLRIEELQQQLKMSAEKQSSKGGNQESRKQPSLVTGDRVKVLSRDSEEEQYGVIKRFDHTTGAVIVERYEQGKPPIEQRLSQIELYALNKGDWETKKFRLSDWVQLWNDTESSLTQYIHVRRNEDGAMLLTRQEAQKYLTDKIKEAQSRGAFGAGGTFISTDSPEKIQSKTQRRKRFFG